MKKDNQTQEMVTLKPARDNRWFLWCLLVFFIGIAIDLITKALAEIFIAENEVIEFIPWFMNLTLHYNKGMAFSMLADNPVLMKIITWATLPFIIGLLVVAFILPKSYNPHRLFVALVASGAVGNFVDRVLIEEGVRDFMDISSIGFGVCNFADYFIVLGGVALLFCILFVGDDALLPLIGKSKTKDEEEKTEQK